MSKEQPSRDGYSTGQKQQRPNQGDKAQKRWKDHKEEPHRDDLSDPGSHTGAASCSEPDILEPVSQDGAASCSEPDILEHEVKRTLGSARANTASEGDGIPAKLFKILKDDAIKTLHSTRQQIWKTQQWPPDWKIQSASQFPGGAVRKNVQTTRPLHSPPTLVRLCLKSSKLGFSIT